MKTKPKIGIIGGAGPMAGCLLMQKVIQTCQEKYQCQNDDDFPYIMLISNPFADMLRNPERVVIGRQLLDCFQTLVANQVEVAALACNTLHEFIDEDSFNKLTFINMIKELGFFLEQNQFDDPIILCTNTSAQCRLHQKYFDCSYPDDNLQADVQRLIDRILTGQFNKEDSLQFAQRLNFFLSSRVGKKTALILGCTEFSVFDEKFPLHDFGLSDNLILVDPMTIIAQKLCTIIFNK